MSNHHSCSYGSFEFWNCHQAMCNRLNVLESRLGHWESPTRTADIALLCKVTRWPGFSRLVPIANIPSSCLLTVLADRESRPQSHHVSWFEGQNILSSSLRRRILNVFTNCGKHTLNSLVTKCSILPPHPTLRGSGCLRSSEESKDRWRGSWAIRRSVTTPHEPSFGL